MNTHTRTALGAVILGSVSSSTLVLAQENPVEDAVNKHIEPLIEAGLVPGAVVAVRSKGIDSYYTLGKLDYESDESPSFDTLYEVGSISKVFTGVLFADAVRRGEVTKDTLVDDLLPDEFDARDFEGTEVELWHLTTHTSGWPTAPANLRPADAENPFLGYTDEMMYYYISNASPKRTPGTEFEYSNLGVGLLGTLVSKNAGTGYEDLVIERVFEPLGIEEFWITLDDDERDRLAPATSSKRATKPWGATGAMDPAGMWVSSAPAMLEFAVANLEGGEGEIYESLEFAREPMADSGFGRVCFGWMLALDGSTYWHNGMTGGYSSYMAINHDLDLAVVVLTNSATLTTTTVGEKLVQQLAGMDVEPVQLEAADPIDADYAAKLVGEYESPYYVMEITHERGGLFAKITGQTALSIVEIEGEHRFRYEAVDAELEFEMSDDGTATSVTLYQNGQVIKSTRVSD
ncbi:MAG: serine hydrolase [Phycisphaerales bacterium]|nr:serine hydrolase [Phycisphaerales bacterium]